MKEREYDEVLEFFREVLKYEIDYWTDSSFNYINEDIKNNTKSARSMQKRNEIGYNDLVFLSQFEEEDKNKIRRLVYESISSAFIYFFRRLEEGENIEQGERINFELVAVNEKTGQRTKLISATPDEDGIENDFQEWILDNCQAYKWV
jgi:hypothetical protein